MRIDPLIQSALDALPVPYTIVKKRDHYFAVVHGVRDRICIGGNHDRTKAGLARQTARSIDKLRASLSEKEVSR
jgi:hypothetical protein